MNNHFATELLVKTNGTFLPLTTGLGFRGLTGVQINPKYLHVMQQVSKNRRNREHIFCYLANKKIQPLNDIAPGTLSMANISMWLDALFDNTVLWFGRGRKFGVLFRCFGAADPGSHESGGARRVPWG